MKISQLLNYKFSLFLALIFGFSFSLTAQSVSATYSAGNIPSNDGSFSSACNGAATPLTVTIPAGALVTGVDVSYTVSTQGGAWTSEQRSRLNFLNTGTTEIGPLNDFIACASPGSGATGVCGNSAGVTQYTRTGLTIANGITATGILNFGLEFFGSWPNTAEGCNQIYHFIENNTWTVTVFYTNDVCSNPQGGVATATPAVGCQNATIGLSVTGHTVAIGTTYQWFISSDNINFTPIAGATSPNVSATLQFAGDNFFRCVVTCTDSGETATSTTVTVNAISQLSGVYTINNLLPTAGTNFNNFQDAFAALACGVDGPVTMNVEAGQTFTSSGTLLASFTGTATNTITFQKSGAGNNPAISFTGTTATNDAGLRLDGSDWITWDGIDLVQGGTSTADWIEHAIHIRKATGTNGARNNTFRNFSIDLGDNTATTLRGVFMENAILASSPDGASINNTFENITITNVNSAGFWLAGSATAGNQDVNNQIINCNITLKSAAAIMYGIYLTGQQNFVINNNTVGNYNLSSTSTANLIYVTGAAATTNGVINNNTLENVINASTGIVYGIQIFNGGLINIAQNTIRNLSTTGTVRGIFLNSSATTENNVHRNRIYNITSLSTGATYAAGIQSGAGVNRIYNNMITGITAATSTAVPSVRGIDVTAGTSQQIYNNTVILSGTSASSAALAWSVTLALDVRNNIFVNNSTSTNFAAALSRSTAGAPNFTETSGNNLYYAGVPGPNNVIYRNGANFVEDLTSYLALSIETVGYTENLQFTLVEGEVSISQTEETSIESGGQNLALVNIDYYGTARGPYPLAGQQPNGGTATDVGAEENDFFRFVPLNAPECATLTSPSNNTLDVCTGLPLSLTWSPSLTGTLPTDGYDVFFGTTTPPPFVANVSGTSYPVTGLISGETYYWSVEPKNAVGNAENCDIFSFTTANHIITSTTDGSVCGLGTVELQATASSGSINWWANATGGTPLSTGGLFTTPVLNNTTTYYVSTVLGGGVATGGKPAAAATTATLGANWGLVFDVVSPTTLLSVDVYPNNTTGGSMVIELRDNTGALIQTVGTFTYPSGDGTVPHTLNLNLPLAPGTGYRLVSGAGMVGNIVRETSGNTFPYASSDNNVTVTSGFITNPGSTTYYWFYNWVLSSGCESNRVPVVATVSEADDVNINASTTATCPGELVTLTASSLNTNYTYTWMPGNLSGTTVEVSPLQTTTYTVTGTDGICTDQQTVTITVTGAVLGTISGNTDICIGGQTTLNLVGSSGDIQWQIFDGTNWNDIAGQTTSSLTISPTSTTDYRAAVSFSGCPTITTPPVTIVVTDVETPTVQGASICGIGTADLQANAAQGVIHWWANETGGAPIATGPIFTTPEINTTTTYYASNIDGGTTFNGGRLAPSTTTGAALSNYTQQFTIDENITLNSIQVFSTTGTAVTISLYNFNGSTLLETTGSVPVVAGSSPNINLGWTIPPGTYRLGAVSMTGAFVRENPANPGFTYPIPLGSVGQISGYTSSITGALTTNANIYYYVYNWNISTGCESPRLPVVATVTPADAVIAAASASTICPGETVNIGAASANTNYTYSWMPGNLSGASIDVNPLQTTTYTVTGTDGVCTAVDQVTVTVNGAEVGAISSGGTICAGDVRTITISGVVGDIQWQSFDGSNWIDIAGETGTTIAVTPTQTTEYRVSVSFPGCPAIFSASTTVTVNNPQVLSSQGEDLCAPGEVTFSATPSQGATIEWFDAPENGNSLGTGNTYTMNITENTTLYAQASSGGGSGNVGPLNPASVGAFAGWNSSFQWMNFTVLQNLTLQSVDMFFSAAVGTPFSVVIRQAVTNDVVFTYNGTVSVTDATAATPQTVNLDAELTPGDYQISYGTTAASFRNSTGAVYPYTLSNLLSITGNTFDPVYYYLFYNWQVSAGCASGLIPVTSTVGEVVVGSDVVVSCGPYIWIDGNLYTENNNSQTFLIPGGSVNGCDSLVVLDLTIQTFNVTATNNGSQGLTASSGESFQWVTCPSLTPIAGATSQSFFPTQNGSYAVIATDENGCQGTSNCVTVTNVGLENYDANNVSIYPNPTNDMVIIEFNTATAKIELFDTQGKLIQTTQQGSGESISLKHEQSGVYLIRITTENATSIHRIVKQ
jgi:hypothetical protein